MSEQQPQSEKTPDLRSILNPRRRDEGKAVFDEFVSSNDNNPTKSRIPSVYGMTVDQLMNVFWASTAPTVSVQIQGKVRVFPRTVAGAGMAFKMWYDENAISAGGESRKELETAALGYYLRDMEDIEKAKSDRASEGVKSKK